MTHEELTAVLTGPFCRHFADKTAARVLAEGDLAMLYETAVAPPASLSAAMRHRAAFRGAYVLERIYFSEPERFAPFAERFCRTDFPACANPGARRSLAKIMAHLLRTAAPDDATLERIAACAAQWAIDPKTKIAVRIWCVEILRLCRERCPWIGELWDDLLATLSHDASPAIAARMRNGWKER